MHRAFSVAATTVVMSVSFAALVVTADPAGSTAPPSASPTAGTAYVTPSPTTSPLDPRDWATYTSDQYGYDIGYPPGWTVRPAERDWSFEVDATDRASPATEDFISPDGDVRVSVWSVPLDPAALPDWGFEGWLDFVPWVESYCEATGSTPCTGIEERAVPLCLERRDCHPGVMVTFDDAVQAFFTAGIYEGDEMIVMSVWGSESDPATTAFDGREALLEAFLSTMAVWPKSVPLEERGPREPAVVRVIVSTPAGANDGPGTACDADLGTSSSALPGSIVTVTSESGVIMGMGQVPAQGTLFGHFCVFDVLIGLIRSADYYTVDLGERFGSLTISRSDLVGKGDEVRFNLASQ